MSRCAPGLIALALLGGGLSPKAAGQEANPPAFAREGVAEPVTDSPVYIFVDRPIDPETLRDELQRPDYVLLRSEVYARLRASRSDSDSRPPESVVESVTIEGDVGPEVATLTAAFTVRLRDEGPVWVPVRLAGLVVRRATDDGLDLPVQADATGGWDVELRGARVHPVRIETVVPVRSDSEGQSLEVPIPPSPSTRLELNLPSDARALQTGQGPTLPIDAIPARPLRLSLTPRDRVVLRWRRGDDAGASGPPLLTAQGEITLEVERASARARSTWSIRCERGTVEEVTIQLPESDSQVDSVEVEDVSLPLGGPIAPEKRELTVPLPRPLRRGEAVRIGLTTRRELPTGAAAFTFRGYPIVGAASQGGIVAVVQGQDLWVSARPGPGLRAIDPRKELPDALRARPATVAAFRFTEQPFELELQRDPSPPWLAVQSRCTLTVDRGAALVDADLDYRVIRGRIAEVRVGLGPGLELVGAGPESVVESYQVLEDSGQREAVLRLTARAVAESGFRIRLSGRRDLTAPASERIGLFQPREGSARGSTLAVTWSREVVAELDGSDLPQGVSALGTLPPSDWSWPAGKPASGEVQWYRLAPALRELPIVVQPRRLHVEQSSRVVATLESGRLDLRQETRVQVRGGTLSRLEVLVPPELEGSWEVEGDAISVRDRIGREPNGSYRYRLQLARELNDTLELRLGAHVTFERDPAGEIARRTVPWIRVVEGSPGPVRIALQARPGLSPQGEGPGWTDPNLGRVPTATNTSGPPARLEWDGVADDAFPAVAVAAPRPAGTPPVLISRLLLRTVETADNSVRTTAWLRVERHPGTITLRLPAGARPLLARAGTRSLTFEATGAASTYRLAPPVSVAGPTVLNLSWDSPERIGWETAAPEALEGAVVEDSMWEVRLPTGRVVVGVPPGWEDMNRWTFDRYFWRRQPRLSLAGESAWAGLDAPRELIAEGFAGHQSYLFARPGPPLSMGLRTVSRPVLVGVCSGAALVVGIGLLLSRPPARLIWLCGLASALALVVTVEPNAGLLALQSSLAGLILTVVAALTRRFVERRLPTGATGRASTFQRVPVASATGTAAVPAVTPEAEESTIIRRRPSTTVDFAPAAEGAAPRSNP